MCDGCADVRLDYASLWTVGDPQLDCVSVKADTGKFQSKACDTLLAFACMQLPGSAGLNHTSSFIFIIIVIKAIDT